MCGLFVLLPGCFSSSNMRWFHIKCLHLWFKSFAVCSMTKWSQYKFLAKFCSPNIYVPWTIKENYFRILVSLSGVSPDSRPYLCEFLWLRAKSISTISTYDGKNWETEEELLPSGHQAPKIKLGLITFTGLNLINRKTWIILHHPHCCYVYIPGTTCLHILLAHPCLYYYLLSPQYTVLHILFYCTFYSLSFLIFILFLPIFIYILLCYVLFFALSIERTCPDLHFSTDYILYNWVCDE